MTVKPQLRVSFKVSPLSVYILCVHSTNEFQYFNIKENVIVSFSNCTKCLDDNNYNSTCLLYYLYTGQYLSNTSIIQIHTSHSLPPTVSHCISLISSIHVVFVNRCSTMHTLYHILNFTNHYSTLLTREVCLMHFITI